MLERRINERVAKMDFREPVDAVVAEIAPGWDWIEASSIGGSRKVVLTKYARGVDI